MSYILDALQRADTERERGHVPGLRSQIVPPASRKTAPARRWKPWHLVVMAATLLVAAGAWWWSGQTPPNPPPTAPSPSASQPSAPDAPPAAVADAGPAAALPEPVLPILAPPRPEPPRRASPSTAAASTAGEGAAPAAAKPAAPATVPPASAGAAPDTAATPVRTFAELSPEARARLPAINVSGSTYSRNPALRMLIVNGKVLQEGQDIAPGFKLESIGQRSAVLNHQGTRYSIGY